jgi:hypothetical protein
MGEAPNKIGKTMGRRVTRLGADKCDYKLINMVEKSIVFGLLRVGADRCGCKNLTTKLIPMATSFAAQRSLK